MKQIVSIVNPRQGAGKTGLAVNVAACLALAEKKTLLVDGDPQGDATARLLSTGDSARPGLFAFLTDRADRQAVVTDTALDCLKVISAGSDLFRAEQELLSFPDRADLMNRKIGTLAGEFEYIIIDSPSSLGPLTIWAMAASEAVLIPLPCRANAAASLEALLPVVAGVKKQQRPALTIAGIVVTHCDGWAEARAIFPEETLTGIQAVVLDAMIPKTDVPAGRPSHEPPAVMRDVMSAVSESYLDLTAELLRR